MTSQEKKAERIVQHRVQRATMGLQIPLTQIQAFSRRAEALIIDHRVDDATLAAEMRAFVNQRTHTNGA